MVSERKILVNADALKRLLVAVDPGGFQSNGLGVKYVDDGSGYARKLVAPFSAKDADDRRGRLDASGHVGASLPDGGQT